MFCNFEHTGRFRFFSHFGIVLKTCLDVILSIFENMISTLWFQLEDMFQSIVTPQGIEKVTIQFIDTPTKVYAIGARLFLSKVPLEVLQNWVLIQLKVTPHILGKKYDKPLDFI